jgi:hypothetical protein
MDIPDSRKGERDCKSQQLPAGILTTLIKSVAGRVDSERYHAEGSVRAICHADTKV